MEQMLYVEKNKNIMISLFFQVIFDALFFASFLLLATFFWCLNVWEDPSAITAITATAP